MKKGSVHLAVPDNIRPARARFKILAQANADLRDHGVAASYCDHVRFEVWIGLQKRLFDNSGRQSNRRVELSKHLWPRNRLVRLTGQIKVRHRVKPGTPAMFFPLMEGEAGTAHYIDH